MRRVALMLALVLLGAGDASSGDASGDADVESFPLILRTDARSDVLTTTVMDARTGRPIAGAVVRGYVESVDGRATAVNALLLTMETDEYGLAVGEIDTKAFGASHWIVSAPGYRPYAEYHGYWPPERVDLEPSTPVAVRVLGPFGDPAGDVTVDGYSGCPHAPPAVRGRTDAEGVFRAADGSPEGFSMWVEAPGCACTNEDLPPVYGDEPCVEVLSPGIVVRGTLRDADGRPLPGMVLRGTNYPRGPATGTDLAGQFVLAGLDPEEGVQVFHPTVPIHAPHTIERVTGDVLLDLVWTLDGLGVEGALGGLTVRARGVDAQAVEDLDLLVVGPDGRGQAIATDVDGEVSLDLSAGRYRVRGDDPFGPYDIEEALVVVPAGGDVALDLVLSPRPRLQIEGDVPPDLALGIVAAGRTHYLSRDPEGEAPAPIWLPAEARAVVCLRNVEQRWAHFVPVGPAADGVRTCSLDVPTAHRIRLADDDSFDGVYALLAPRAYPRVERLVDVVGGVITVRWGGTFELTVHLEDGTPPRVVPLDLPPLTAGAIELRVDLDRHAVSANDSGGATLLVSRADGLPVPELTVSGGDVGAAWSGFSGRGYRSPIEVSVPCRVLLTAPGLHPLQLDVTHPGEQAVVFPAGGIDLETVDTAGAPVSAAVLVNGVLYEAPEGRLTLRGFPAGDHAIVAQRTSAFPTVAAGVRWRFSLGEGEKRAKTLILP